MPGNRQTYQNLFDMPTGLRKFVLSQEFDDADSILQKTYALTEAQKILLGDQVMATIYNEQDVPAMVAKIRAAVVPTPVAEANWKIFLSDLLKLELWPLRELFGSELTSILNEAQISTAGWPQFHVLLRPLTFSGAANEIATMVGFTLMGSQQRERLRDLLMSRAKGVRIDTQVREVLVRPADFGGLGLDQQTADRTIVAMNQLIAAVQIMSEDDYANWLAEDARKKAEPPKRTGELPEDPEIAAIRAKMPIPPVAQSVLDQSVDATIAGLSFKTTDPYLLARLKHIVGSRFRDVRSAFDVQQLLQRDSKVGGMGLEKSVSDQVLAQIEQSYKTFHDPIMEEEKKKLNEQIEQQKIKIEERRTREAEEHAKWYQERIVSRKKDEEQKQQLAEKMRSTMLAYATGPTTGATLPIDVKEQKLETKRFGEMVPAVTAGATPISPSKPLSSAPSAPAAMAPVPTAGRVARPEVRVSMETVKLQAAQPAMKPRMDDVTASGGPRLMGPIQELRSLTLSEFRRLAKDPEAAAQKILQKIEILGQESFEKRVEGVKAWQASPLQEAYVRLVSDSFKLGKSVVEVADQKRATGEDALHPEEVNAVISLNSKLHY